MNAIMKLPEAKLPKSELSTDDAFNEVSMTTMPGRVVSKTRDCARLQTGWRIGLPPTKLIAFLQTQIIFIWSYDDEDNGDENIFSCPEQINGRPCDSLSHSRLTYKKQMV